MSRAALIIAPDGLRRPTGLVRRRSRGAFTATLRNTPWPGARTADLLESLVADQPRSSSGPRSYRGDLGCFALDAIETLLIPLPLPSTAASGCRRDAVEGGPILDKARARTRAEDTC